MCDDQPFNKLTPSQAERLDTYQEELSELIKECAKAIQIVAKVKRHGYDSHNPDDPEGPDNRTLLAIEAGHVNCVLEMLIANGDISPAVMSLAESRKRDKIVKYLHHQ